MAYQVPENVIILWPGTVAAIPSGWSRETTLDGKYVKGTADGVNPGGTGGAASHTHTVSGTHSHTMASHTHNVTFGNSYNDKEGTSDSGGSTTRSGHTHSGTTSATSGGGLSAVSVTYDSVANDPNYLTFIFIKSDGTPVGIPSGGVILVNDASYEENVGGWAGFYSCAGGVTGTPALSYSFLKGADTGEDGGDSGGSTQNLHLLTHTHVVSSHTHTGTVPRTVLSGRDSDNDSSENPRNDHTHSFTTSGFTDVLGTNPTLSTGEVVQPAHTYLLPAQNKSGADLLPPGLIGFWLGTLASIPAGWVLCDGSQGTTDMRGRHLKCSVSTADIGNTGGSNTHTHASQNHTHTVSVAHSHSWTASHSGLGALDRGGSTAYVFIDRTGAFHNATTDNATSTYSNAATSADSSSNEPEYVEVAFIQFLGVWAVTVSDNVSVSELGNQTLVHGVIKSEAITVSENRDTAVRDGLSISIWKENIFVSDAPKFPAPNDLFTPVDFISVEERVNVKISTGTNEGVKASFDVSI